MPEKALIIAGAILGGTGGAILTEAPQQAVDHFYEQYESNRARAAQLYSQPVTHRADGSCELDLSDPDNPTITVRGTMSHGDSELSASEIANGVFSAEKTVFNNIGRELHTYTYEFNVSADGNHACNKFSNYGGKRNSPHLLSEASISTRERFVERPPIPMINNG